MGEMTETVEFGGWKNCLRLTDGRVEAIVTREVGPRVVRFGLVGGPNEFREFPEQQGITGGDEWHVFGGHRLWHAPEQKPRSYQPDNSPLEWELTESGVTLVQPVEAATGIQKELTLEFGPKGALVARHTVTNRGAWPVSIAPWALTVVAGGGTAVIPQPALQSSENLLPNRTLVLWPYTRLNDPRFAWGERYHRIRTDAALEAPIKIGTQPTEGWCGYVNRGRLFLKRVDYVPGAAYPDHQCGIEVYTAGEFLELETLGRLVTLEPEQSAIHVERWFLFEGADASSEEALDETVLPRIRETE